MRYAALIAIAITVVAFAGIHSSRSLDAAQHFNRIHAVMAGFDGDDAVQYVELRQAIGNQHLVQGSHLCFFDAGGDPWARFTFTGNAGSGASGSSILVGSGAFEGNWAAGSPDFFFSSGTVDTIAAGASTDNPVPYPAGKVAFGFDGTSEASEMCAGSFGNPIDSVAYGQDYAGTVEHGTAFPQDLPISGSQALVLTGPLCAPSSCDPPRDNSVDYSLLDANQAGNHPRNNAGATGPLGDVPDPTPTPTPGPTPAGDLRTWGDVDCDDNANAVDALKLLRHVAALSVPQNEPCPDIGTTVLVDGVERVWGDVNCTGAADAVDSLQMLRHVAGLPVLQTEPCPDIGTQVTVVAES